MAKVILKDVESTGVGSNVATVSALNHTFVIDFVETSGLVSKLTIAIEGSIDGTNWFLMHQADLSAEELADRLCAVHVNGKLVNHVRADIETLTTSGSAKVSINYLGSE
jgi:hypothetical protein